MTNFVCMLYSFLHRALRCGIVVVAWLIMGCISDGRETSEQTTLVRVGQSAPDFTVEMLDGEDIRLRDLRGRVVMLTFWDSECPDCRSEMAVAQERIVERMKVAGVHYLPIFRGYERQAVADFCASKGYTFPVGLDPRKAIYNLYATKYVPRTFLIDQQGVIRYIYVEYDLSTLDEILALAEGLAR